MRVSLLVLLLAAVCSAQRRQDTMIGRFREGAARAVNEVRTDINNLEDRFANQFGSAGTAGRWSAITILIPGHSLDSSSFSKLIEFGISGGNGPFAAVFNPQDDRFRRNSGSGDVLTLVEARTARIFALDFTDRFAPTGPKAHEINEFVRAIITLLGGQMPLTINVVTHSAGDADFDTALASSLLTPDVIRIRNRIAVGPVFGGTFVGNVGGAVLGRMGRVGRQLGSEAAAELAENSPTVRWLTNEQPRLNARGGIYSGTRRVDILTDGVGDLTPRFANRRSSSRGGEVMGAGDGFVQSSQRRPFVTETRVVHAVDPFATNHLMQPGYEGVIKIINEVLSQ